MQKDPHNDREASAAELRRLPSVARLLGSRPFEPVLSEFGSSLVTDLLRERYCDTAKKQKLIDQVPIGRLGQPADIAGLAAFLASSWGDFICGQEILVDGGRTFYRSGP